jgi:predicted DNA-binding protein (MmcQ/YjbR family)
MSIDYIRNICSKLPLTAEDVKWDNDLCFCVEKKMYCVTALDGPFRASFKCDEEDFSSLTERESIIPAPYMARNKWVMVQDPKTLNKKEWDYYIKKSYELIASKLPQKTKRKINFTIIKTK